MKAIIILSVILALPMLSLSATIRIPADYPTIQQGIHAATKGDTVLVAPGTYMENIDFKGKAITVISTSGAVATVIDGKKAGSVVTFQSGEGLDSVLDGFTVMNGDVAGSGGGIQCNDSSPTIKNNIIKGNTAGWAAGGIWCWGPSCSPMITNNTITNNTAFPWGGGIFNEANSPTIMNNIITGNTADEGGGICGGYSIIANNIIMGNTATNCGGGINCWWPCTMMTITNNTISGNKAVEGGGIYCMHGGCSPIVMNTIIWNNAARYGPEICMKDNSTLTISYSDVKGGKASVYVDPSCTLNWDSGMIDSDPLITQGLHGYYYLSQQIAGQPADSPCVDTGSDLAGNLGMDVYWTRTDAIPDSGIVDMGFHYGLFTFPTLQTDTYQIQESTGGDADFLLLTGTSNASRNYLMLGSVTGTDPGTSLPGSKATLPLNWDLFTNVVLDLINTPVCMNFMGQLDGTGSAKATFNTLGPIPGAAGITMNFAYALNAPWDFVSCPVAIEIIP